MKQYIASCMLTAVYKHILKLGKCVALWWSQDRYAKKGSLYSITLWADTCLVNHRKCYPEPAACFTVIVLLSRLGCGHSTLLGWERVDYLLRVLKEPVISAHTSIHHMDEPQQGWNSCLRHCHLLLRMTGEAGSWFNRAEWPPPSLPNAVYSEAGR